MTDSKRNFAWSLGISIAFAAITVSALATRVEDIQDTPMSLSQPGWHAYPVALLETAGPPPPVYVTWLRPDDMPTFLQHPELRIYFSTYSNNAQLTGGTLEVLGTQCVYATPAGARLSDQSLLPFVQNRNCNPLREKPTGELRLVVRLATRQRIGVEAFVPIFPSDEQRPHPIHVIRAPGSQGPFPVLRGYYVDHLAQTSTRRVDLLAYLWQIEPATWLWRTVGLACVLLFVAFTVTPHGPLTDFRRRWRFALRAAAGTGCAAAALGLMYAVIVPPFQAADEPTHLLGFAEITHRTDIIENARQWSLLTHFERLRFHPAERFRPIDVTQPMTTPWQQEPLRNLSIRGGHVRLWSLIGPQLRNLSVERTLLALRLLNVLLFAAVVAFGIATMVLLTDVPFPQLAAFSFLFVPSLPFFATYVSNYAFLTSGYVLFSFGVLVTVFGGRHGSYAGLVLGFGMAVILSLSRSALPMGAMLATILAGRLVIGERGVFATQRVIFRALGFWSGLSVGLATAAAFMDPAYTAYLVSLAASYSPETDWTRILALPYRLSAAGGTIVTAVAVEVGLFHMRRALARRLEGTLLRFARIASVLAVAIIAGVMVASLFVEFPTLRYVNLTQRPSIGEYVKEATLSALTMFRLERPDFLTSTSFWAGFGWLDTIPPDWFISTLTTLTAIALIALLMHFVALGSISGLAWLVTIGVGWTMTFVLYAVITLTQSPDLHGRYLLGLYLSVLPIFWSSLLFSDSVGTSRLPVSRWHLCFAICLAMHTYSISFILSRHF